MPDLELYGTASCPYTREVRERLAWEGKEFVEYDVELDHDACARFRQLSAPPLTVPLLVQAGKVIQVGWQGRGCVVAGN